jgi:hypothetical protein
MAAIKGVMLLPLDAVSYRQHTAHHTFLAKVNLGTKTPDSRLALTQLVEESVRKEMQRHFTLTISRVLRWEEMDLYSRYITRFRELDGVFQAANGITVLLEVKASASRSSVSTGLKQLRAALKVATYSQPNTVGILAIADLGVWFETFGHAAAQPLVDYFIGMDMELIEWPPRLPIGKTSGIFVSLIPDSVVSEWLPTDLDDVMV